MTLFSIILTPAYHSERVMFSGLKKCGARTLLAVLVWAGQSTLAESRTPNVTVFNLRSYGWEPPDRRELDWPSIAVDHEGRLLVGFTVRERTGLVTRTQPSLGFRIVRFSPDGKANLSLSIPTNVAGKTGIYLSDTDQMVARANDSLQVLQAEGGGRKKPFGKSSRPAHSGATFSSP